MSTGAPHVRACHLYPEHLNIYADRGNIAVLQRRLEWRGLVLEVVEAGIGDPIPADCHLYYLGGGQDRDQKLVAEDLIAKADPLRLAAAGGAVVLGVCGGYQLLGHRYAAADGRPIPGIGMLDLETTAADSRLIGDVVLDVTLGGRTDTVVGYENHAGRTHLGGGCTPLGHLRRGHGNNGADGCEGAVAGRTVGTYLHGPLLPKNPWLADTLLGWALECAGSAADLEPLDDRLEQAAHAEAATRAGQKR
ncbi:type 1 glutamine amidotransferase [Candidatus Poriferisocius sp.]|uniref:type 1 glutamine amidotransferase n=1 Tax=Candidatus Poriferisocius sp. TaxID=3101276 RepID=UPI003B01DF8E